MGKEGWSMAGKFTEGLPAWSPEGHKAWGEKGPSSWFMELAEANQNPGSVPLCLGFATIQVLLPRAMLATAHRTCTP